MAHFAQLDQNNIVTQVIVVNNEIIKDATGIEVEDLGIVFCQELFGSDTHWVQTSYNGNIRQRYAGIGYKYDESLEAFISPQPYPSWTLDAITTDWVAPVPMPIEELPENSWYVWSEEDLDWVVKSIVIE